MSNSPSIQALEQRLRERLEYLEWLEQVEQQLMRETTARVAEYTSLDLQLKEEMRSREMHHFWIQQNLTRSFLT